MSDELQPGHRVSWMGSINMGRTPVRWYGTVVQATGYGVPYYDDPPRLTAEGYAKEAGRHPAARVVADLPQHGKADVWESAEQPVIVAHKDLRRESSVEALVRVVEAAEAYLAAEAASPSSASDANLRAALAALVDR